MHAAIRTYSGPAAKELFKLIAERGTEVEKQLRGVKGLVHYYLIPTAEGGVSVTICKDQAAAHESTRVAREWVQSNAAHLKASPPAVWEGKIALELS